MFTEQQLKNFKAYVRIQKGGRWNMLSPQAMSATGLSRDDYLFVLSNYDELKKAVDDAKAKSGV